MNNTFQCRFCNSYFPVTMDTYQRDQTSFYILKGPHNVNEDTYRDKVNLEFYSCPQCGKISVILTGVGSQFEGKEMSFFPSSNAVQYPEYVPQSIREDYEEACSIAKLSPKASATLSRRCLQGMIRDYWNVTGKKSLQQEIDSIKDKVDPQVNYVLHSLRQLGNIGAHPEKDINLILDIEPGEAEKMIKLIEFLMSEWYIKRHDTERLLKEINSINEQKKEARNCKQ